MTGGLVSIPELRAHLGPHPERFTYALPGDRLLALVEAVEAAHLWARARDRTNTCHDEFDWTDEGYAACAEWQNAEDDAAERLTERVAKFSFEAAAGAGEHT